MARTLPVLALLGLAAVVLCGCQQGQLTWYEERCKRIGLEPGTAGFNECIDRDRQWVEQNRQRALRSTGP